LTNCRWETMRGTGSIACSPICAHGRGSGREGAWLRAMGQARWVQTTWSGACCSPPDLVQVQVNDLVYVQVHQLLQVQAPTDVLQVQHVTGWERHHRGCGSRQTAPSADA
jgi:hypothetical protein